MTSFARPYLFVLLFVIGFEASGFEASPAMAQTDPFANCSENAKRLIDAGRKASQIEETERLYKQALADSPKCLVGLRGMGSFHSRDEKRVEARAYTKTLLRYYPDDRAGLMLEAHALAKIDHNFRAAAKILTDILAADGPDNGAVYYVLASVYSLANNLDESLRYLKLAMSIRAGWGNSANAQRDPDFEYVRKDQRFWNLVRGAR